MDYKTRRWQKKRQSILARDRYHSPASVVNAGTDYAAVLNFEIPAGAPGPQGPSGTGLPAVTEADNGKFARVVNGAWAADAVPTAEEASF